MRRRSGDEPETILSLARDMGVRITRVVASHAHLDHILAARAIVEATAAPFLLHEHDLPIAENLPNTARMWMNVDVPPAPRPDAYPVDGDDLEVAGVTLKVIHTPATRQAACACTPPRPACSSAATRSSASRSAAPTCQAAISPRSAPASPSAF